MAADESPDLKAWWQQWWRKPLNWFAIGVVVLLGFAGVTRDMVLHNLRDIQDSKKSVWATVSVDVATKEHIWLLSEASARLEQQMSAIGSAIGALTDEAIKTNLQIAFGPASESAKRIAEIAGRLAEIHDQLETFEGRDEQRTGGLESARRHAEFSLIAPTAHAAAQPQPKKAKRLAPGTSEPLRRDFERTVQQEQKIKLMEKAFYVFGGLGALLLLVLVFTSGATQLQLVGVIKIYFPSLLSSWGTFLAAISL